MSRPLSARHVSTRVARRTSWLAIALCAAVASLAAAAAKGAQVGVYDVAGARTSLDRSAVVASGAAIVGVDHASLVVTASASDLRALRSLPYAVTPHAQPRARAEEGPAREEHWNRIRR